jgi:hypothetical protein
MDSSDGVAHGAQNGTRGDAANAEGNGLLEVEGLKYTIRLRVNSVLKERIGWLLKRPVGQSPHEIRGYHASFHSKPGHGPSPVVRWRKSSGILMNRIRALASSYQHDGRPRWWWLSRTSSTAARQLQEGKNAVTWARPHPASLRCQRGAAATAPLNRSHAARAMDAAYLRVTISTRVAAASRRRRRIADILEGEGNRVTVQDYDFAASWLRRAGRMHWLLEV